MRWRGVRLWAAVGLAGVAGLPLLHAWHPTDDVRASICLFRRTTGIPCPGCGMTRAFAHLAKGDWTEAARYHPLSFVVALELALGWGWWGLALAGRLPRVPPERLTAIFLANTGLLVALWLGRLATGTLPG